MNKLSLGKLTKQSLSASCTGEQLEENTVYAFELSNVKKYTGAQTGDSLRLRNKIYVTKYSIYANVSSAFAQPLLTRWAIVQPKFKNNISSFAQTTAAGAGTDFIPNFFDNNANTNAFIGKTNAGTAGTTGSRGIRLASWPIDTENYKIIHEQTFMLGPGAAGTDDVTANSGVEGFSSIKVISEEVNTGTLLYYEDEWNATDDSSQQCGNPVYLLLWTVDPNGEILTNPASDIITVSLRCVTHYKDVL